MTVMTNNLRLIFSVFILALIGILPVAHAEGVETISRPALLKRMDMGDAPLILDVRTPREYTAGHVPGAINIPYTELAGRLGELTGKQEKEVVVYCQSGRRAGIAEGLLQNAGFKNLLHLEGDMAAWRNAHLPLQMTEKCLNC